jgi:hypothetical protein
MVATITTVVTALVTLVAASAGGDALHDVAEGGAGLTGSIRSAVGRLVGHATVLALGGGARNIVCPFA